MGREVAFKLLHKNKARGAGREKAEAATARLPNNRPTFKTQERRRGIMPFKFA